MIYAIVQYHIYLYISSISHAQTDTHTHTVYIYNTFIHIVCMRLHLSHVCMFSPIGPSAWKTSPLKQWSSAPQWRAHGGGGAGENSLTCCRSTRCNCSNKQSLSTLKILKMLQILKCIFFCYYYIILVVMFWLNLWCFLPPNNHDSIGCWWCLRVFGSPAGRRSEVGALDGRDGSELIKWL